MDRKNVKSFIKEYKKLLNVLNIDICHSELQNKWFVFRRDSICFSGYDFFFEVNDESELVDILLGEVAYDMHIALGNEDYDTPEWETENIADIVDEYRKKGCLPEIEALLNYIKSEKDS